MEMPYNNNKKKTLSIQKKRKRTKTITKKKGQIWLIYGWDPEIIKEEKNLTRVMGLVPILLGGFQLLARFSLLK
jgi:hypothetical protein